MGKDKPSQADVDEGLKLLASKREYQAKVARGELKGPVAWKDQPQEVKDKAKAADKRRVTKVKLILAKAAERGITVSDAEVESEIAKAKA